ncbi:heavy metal-associated isoprenylated plant protein 16-like [Apium graveolens]|uniref:heavy metal-associated isoprenylated plant protein 16-like n=1 Tax=Apium graveolens TaxID=4045 RepID=UPI003D78D2C8
MAKQKVVIRVTTVNASPGCCLFLRKREDSRTKALQIAATTWGVESAALSGNDKNEIVVIGEGIDTIELAKLLRKKIGGADVISVGPDKAEDKKKDEATVVPYYYNYAPYNYSYPLVYHQ